MLRRNHTPNRNRHRSGAGHPHAGGTLDSVRAGQVFEIACIDDEAARMTALRFGMAEGSRVSCVTKIPAGPVVLRSGRQEIAIGRTLARSICVRPCTECGREVN